MSTTGKTEEEEKAIVSSPNTSDVPKAAAVPEITRAMELAKLGALLVINVSTVVLCVGINKVLYSKHNFKFASSLMCFHFVLTYFFVRVAKVLNWYTPKRTDQEIVYVRLGAAMACAVGFGNLSLLYNTMGMFQIFKFTIVLVVCAMEFFWKKKSYPLGIYCSLVVLVGSVLWASVGNVDLTGKGIVFGILGSLSTAVYQITNKATQQDYDLKPLQLLEYEQPYCVLWTAIFALFTDDVRAMFFYDFTPKVIALILGSGFFAFGINVSSYMIIGKFGPVTYGVVGHAKALFILTWGVVILQESPSLRTAVGMVVAFGAIVVYTHLSIPKPAAPKPQPSLASQQAVVDARTDLNEDGEEKK